MKLMVLGDYHGDVDYIQKYVLPAAESSKVSTILQVGDFGYADHILEYRDSHDRLNDLLRDCAVSMFHIQGNHDKISYLLDLFGHDRTSDGFVPFRSNMYFIPNGTRWVWGSQRFIALGGAYSIDKFYRLSYERNLGLAPGTYWYPEEEVSDAEFDSFLVDGSPVDIMITHDAPSSVDMGVKLKNIDACQPNRQRIQRAVRAFLPHTLIHGHFHHRYQTEIRCSDLSHTRVIGLAANTPGSWNRRDWKPEDAWMIVNA